MPLFVDHPEWLTPGIIPGIPFFQWYGLMYIFAFITAYLLFMYQLKKSKLNVDKDQVINFFFWGIVGLLIGARVFYMVFFDARGTILKAPWTLILPFDEHWNFTGYRGMNFYGGIVGALAGMVIYARIKKIDILEWGDMLAAGIPLAHTFGRIGNFINGELYGRLTDAPWGMFFRDYDEATNIQLDMAKNPHPQLKYIMSVTDIDHVKAGLLPRHPTQIYSMLFECLAIWAIIWFIFRNRKPYKGFIIGLYITLYGFVRFIIDYFRMPLRNEFMLKLADQNNPTYLLLSPFNFTLDQLFSFLTMAAGIITLVAFYKITRKDTALASGEDRPDLRKLRKKIE
ncbi:MAG: prolipoprotein diacylglyceryl transferase [Spirochaetaceae bacterium]|nr:MAG: prolipoprotein diacylglyceryl transferase [Spirochaetaceae bacterium]